MKHRINQNCTWIWNLYLKACVLSIRLTHISWLHHIMWVKTLSILWCLYILNADMTYGTTPVAISNLIFNNGNSGHSQYVHHHRLPHFSNASWEKSQQQEQCTSLVWSSAQHQVLLWPFVTYVHDLWKCILSEDIPITDLN